LMRFEILYALLGEHCHCGELNGGVDDDRVWMTRTCDAIINRDDDSD
jgi:hypothetical protein